jgi:hypothetical protein
LLCALLVTGAHAQRFTNIDDRQTGWGSCTTCAGGANDADVYWMAQFQSTPSRDGDSTQFYISASKPYSDVLFWNKLGPHDAATTFTWDFWMIVDTASQNAQALEFDIFQFVAPWSICSAASAPM